jgi:uncharacterized membrane protein
VLLRTRLAAHREGELAMQTMQFLESLFRWVHVGAGIVWIGHLYFFNWVNASFAATMDGDTKKKVVPELMPRALWWFRWGAAWTWVSGLLLLLMVFYHARTVFEDPTTQTWSLPAFVMIALVFIAPAIYDALMKNLGAKNLQAAIWIGFFLLTAAAYLMARWAHFSYRGMVIHVGGILGTIMAWNVWFRIWPSQQKIITAVKNGQAPDAAVVALAGQRSRQNTYMSLALLWTMINAHTTAFNIGSWAWALLMGMVLLSWWIGTMLFRRAPKVKGF